MIELDFEYLKELGASEGFLLKLKNILKNEKGSSSVWGHLTKKLLKRNIPFDIHYYLYKILENSWKEKGPFPAWIPTTEEIEKTNIFALMKEKGLSSYEEFFNWSVKSISTRAKFWEATILKLNIEFKEKYESVLDIIDGVEDPIWLSQSKLNIADSCFNTNPDRVAILFQKEGGEIQSMSYGELDKLSNRVANGLITLGFKTGDAIAIDMTMTAEAVAIYLGIVKAGMVAVSIADSFAAEEIKTRLRISNTKAVFTQDYIIRSGKKLPLYKKVQEALAPMTIILPGGDQIEEILMDGDITWNAFIQQSDTFESLPRDPEDYSNILFSSGTTGDPKAIPWTHITPIKSAMDGHFHQNIKEGDVVCWPTNLGWMMGPWLIYASLINKGTMALYYGAPIGKEFGEFVQNTKVSMLGLVPSIVKAWKNSNCMEEIDFSSIQCFSSTGECSNPEDYLYLMSLANYRPIIEYCGGTEIGGGYITGSLVQPASPSTFSTSTLGLDFKILDEEFNETKEGELYLVPPSIGLSQELLNRDHYDVYYKDVPIDSSGRVLRKHGDEIQNLGMGYFRGQGRADDTMNLGGIKTSSADIERVLNSLQEVSETAAIAIAPKGGGPSQLIVYAVLKPQENVEKDFLLKKMRDSIKEKLNPLFKIEDLIYKDILPRTASNKVMRRVLRSEYSEKI